MRPPRSRPTRRRSPGSAGPWSPRRRCWARRRPPERGEHLSDHSYDKYRRHCWEQPESRLYSRPCRRPGSVRDPEHRPRRRTERCRSPPPCWRSITSPSNVQELEIDEPLAGEVLVKIVASGVCHTDAIAQEANFPFPLPGVLGHEGSGIVEAVGDGVTKVAQGDKVIIGWPWCGECRNCLAGRQRYCMQIGPLSARASGSPPAAPACRGAARRSTGTSSASRRSRRTRSRPSGPVVKVADDAPIELLGPLGCGLATGAGAIFNALRPEAGSSHRRSSAPGPWASRRPWRRRSAAHKSIIADRRRRPSPRARQGARRDGHDQREGDGEPGRRHPRDRGPGLDGRRLRAGVHRQPRRAPPVGRLPEHARHRGAHRRRRRSARSTRSTTSPRCGAAPCAASSAARARASSCSRRSWTSTRRAASRSTGSCSSSARRGERGDGGLGAGRRAQARAEDGVSRWQLSYAG